jgi:hypothetical protein
MKKKSASRSAFFNLRVLIGLFVVLAGVFVALIGFGTFSGIIASSAQAQQKHKIINIQGLPPGFDCSKIHELGIDRQENLRAGLIMIACGEARGGSSTPMVAALKQGIEKALAPLAPLAYGAADVDLVTGTETFPNVTQSETFTTANPDNPNEIVVAYNDSRNINANPINISSASVSTDGGTTFTRLTKSNGQGPFSNTLGDPVILYSSRSGTWYAIWLDIACGGQGLGGYKSTTPSDPNSWTHFCIFNEFSADRESGWADNNTSSPHFGNLYVSWNDFAVGGGALFVRVSTDDGVTWTAHQLTTGSPFIRDVQSTDGGTTWTNTYTGPNFTGPSDGTTCTSNSYFATMFSGYWRHMGWGEPAVFNHVVHYVYAQHGSGSDPGDVYYIRSTDSGVTFSAPLKLNTDSTTRPQWQPNLSVSPAGTLFAMWYDGRESTSCQKGNPAVPCYRMWARKSNDNGVTWLADDTFSDVVTPLPAQPDPGIVDCYVGDYDYGSAILTKHLSSWADGRVTINGQSQQDTFTDRELVGFAVTTTDPACNSFTTTQPVDFTINLSDAADPSTVQASDFTVNNIPANSFMLMNSNTQIIFHFNSSPVTTPGLQTMHIPAGAIQRISDGQGIFEFLCTFCYAAMPLQVTSTNPPVGGTFSPPAPGDYPYDVNFNQPVDPASVDTSDLTLTGNAGGSVTAVSVINGNMTAEFTVHFAFGGSVTASIGAGAITAEGCNGNEAFTGTYTVEGCPAQQYVITPGTDAIVAGTTDIGSHCDDCDTMISLPFSFQLYDQIYNTVSVSSNGRLDFVCQNESGGYITACLPPPANVCPYDFTVFATWQDLCTDTASGSCGGDHCNGCGVFTSTSGSPPNRIFNIEWRVATYGTGARAPTDNFEVRLYEGDPNLKFEVIYGTLDPASIPSTGENWVAGVQGDSTAGFFTQDFCNPVANVPPSNVSKTYEIPPCGTPSPTPTATASPTATATATVTATATATATVTASATPTATATATPTSTVRPTPTPRAKPTERPPPTPGPRPTIKPTPYPPPSPTP